MNNSTNRRALVFMGLSVGCLLFIVAYMGRIATQARLEHEVADWQQRVAAAAADQAALEEQLTYVQSDAYVHQQAREALNMVLPGDELVVLVERTPAAVEDAALQLASPDAFEPLGEPIWRQWLQLFSERAAQ